MTAGTYVDVYIDCNDETCGLRFFGSDAKLLEGMTLAMVRRAARERGWTTGVRPQSPRRAGMRNSLLDFCPDHPRGAGR
jgi:hypothetical protein